LDWRTSRRVWTLLLVAVSTVLYVAFRDTWLLPHNEEASVFRSINVIRDWVDANRNSSPIFVFVFDLIRVAIGALFDAIQALLTNLSWVGVLVAAGAIGLVFARRRIALLMVAGFLAFGLMGLWQESLDTLALTLAAVAVSLAIGIPLGIVAGRNERFQAIVNPILDVMQILPTFAYLAPIALLFLIGPPAAIIATMIYAIPPAIRITALGIRGVSGTTIEAATSLGSTHWQVLRNVQLPMARRTIVLGINQTMMMALSMVVITALINAPGLGPKIISALSAVNVGLAFNAGLAIVILAIVLDRLTTAASERVEHRGLAGDERGPSRRTIVAGAFALTIVAAIVGTLALGGSTFPDAVTISFAEPVNTATKWVQLNLFAVTDAIKNIVTSGLVNPLQTVLTTAPWWLVVLFTAGTAFLVGGIRPAIVTAVALLGIVGLQLWDHGMQTLASVLIGTVLTLLVGLALGVWSARSDRVGRVLRPILDAAQTMPSFVYLIPAIALFSATRFTGIVAAIIYAAPPVIRLVEDGIRNVPATVIEAATASGSTSRQLLWKVQLPMARRSLLLAANQGIVLVLAMVVVAGLVGGGGLGFDVVSGFAQREDFGKGLAAGISIVLLGIMLDRITQGAGGRPTGPGRPVAIVPPGTTIQAGVKAP
ncbi:MAG: ABC transporter permease subunit, partial [Chloroflexota bacterium]|nr:ABC transporter permease subunit [Chloroflexota bacterium]